MTRFLPRLRLLLPAKFLARLSATLVACSYSLWAPLASADQTLLQGQDANLKPQRVVYDQRQSEGRLQLPLGAIERIDGRWQPERSRSLSGQLRRRTLEFAPALAEAQIFEHYLALATARGAKVLFNCRGRDCGRSNNWANAYFKIAQLYGREDSQRLQTLWLREGGREHYLVLYQVRRGNKRIYLQQELLSLPAGAGAASPLPSQSQLWQQWQRQGFVRLSEQQGSLQSGGQIEPAWAELIAQVIRAHSERPLLLVSHHYGSGAEAAASGQGQAAKAQLEALGVAPARLQVRSLGDLAPLQASPEGARIDILLR